MKRFFVANFILLAVLIVSLSFSGCEKIELVDEFTPETETENVEDRSSNVDVSDLNLDQEKINSYISDVHIFSKLAKYQTDFWLWHTTQRGISFCKQHWYRILQLDVKIPVKRHRWQDNHCRLWRIDYMDETTSRGWQYRCGLLWQWYKDIHRHCLQRRINNICFEKERGR